MHILDTDTSVWFLTNADDHFCHDHKHISQSRIPQLSKHNIIFLLVLYTVTTLIKERMLEKEDPKVVRTLNFCIRVNPR